MRTIDPLAAAGLSPADSPDVVRRAFAWAVAVHAGQVRKDGSRLIDHVIGVARNVQQFGSEVGYLLTAALLHDVVENTEVPLRQVRERFGETVATLVDAVTNREGEDAQDAADRARDYGDDALLLRLCDRLDGIRRSSGRHEDNRREFLATSRHVHLRLAHQRFPELAEAMRQALDEAETTLD
ncbi:MAG: HD domain-containing protein [Armatimonadota bacterium]